MTPMIHVVDDNAVHLDDIVAELSRRKLVADGCDYVWDLVARVDDEKASAGDLAICDLFTVGYFTNPNNSQHGKVQPVKTMPDDKTNIRIAVLDTLEHHFPRLRDAGLRVIVFTHVLATFADDQPTLTEIREQLLANAVASADDIVEKRQRDASREDVRRLVDRAVAVLETEKARPEC